jgi:hypothetical protein
MIRLGSAAAVNAVNCLEGFPPFSGRRQLNFQSEWAGQGPASFWELVKQEMLLGIYKRYGSVDL